MALVGNAVGTLEVETLLEKLNRLEALGKEQRSLTKELRGALSLLAARDQWGQGRARILLVLSDGGSHTPVDISRKTGLARVTVQVRLSKMLEAGDIVRPEFGRYSLSEQGYIEAQKVRQEMEEAERAAGIEDPPTADA